MSYNTDQQIAFTKHAQLFLCSWPLALTPVRTISFGAVGLLQNRPDLTFPCWPPRLCLHLFPRIHSRLKSTYSLKNAASQCRCGHVALRSSESMRMLPILSKSSHSVPVRGSFASWLALR